VLTTDNAGGLWVGSTASGLYYRNVAGEWSVYNATNTWPTTPFNSVWFVQADDEGQLYVGSNGGVATAEIFTSVTAPVYAVVPTADTAYTAGTNSAGIQTMTVNTGVTGLTYFTVSVTPQISHSGKEAVVFTHLRDDEQLSMNVTKADFDLVTTAQAGFNVEAGDVIQAIIVDDLTNALDVNPVILQ
jgi:hypothetical protein